MAKCGKGNIAVFDGQGKADDSEEEGGRRQSIRRPLSPWKLEFRSCIFTLIYHTLFSEKKTKQMSVQTAGNY